MKPEQIAEKINILGKFCGKRDLETLSGQELKEKYGFEKADVFVLFGGSILAGGDVLAKAVQEGIAETYVIVGGAGHTTEALRQRVHEEYPVIGTAGLSEAEVFSRYLQEIYHCDVDYLEKESTNCGNNITYLLELLKKQNISFKSIILCQDATMQNRMDAGLCKYVEKETVIINYAAYAAQVRAQGEDLVFTEDIHGMWDLDRYVNLLMGEIPRLSDDGNGYGPKGKNYIAHVDIPEDVRKAFEDLKSVYGEKTREANPLFASRENMP